MNTIKVFTRKSLREMLADGGIGFWKLNKERAEACQYVVCVHNKHDARSLPGMDHGAAFLIAKVAGVVGSGDRWLIEFSEYAFLSIAESWDNSRNPVRFCDISSMNLDPAKLQWEGVGGASKAALTAMTMDEAKKGLAVSFGVKPEQIEITVRG